MTCTSEPKRSPDTINRTRKASKELFFLFFFPSLLIMFHSPPPSLSVMQLNWSAVCRHVVETGCVSMPKVENPDMFCCRRNNEWLRVKERVRRLKTSVTLYEAHLRGDQGVLGGKRKHSKYRYVSGGHL